MSKTRSRALISMRHMFILHSLAHNVLRVCGSAWKLPWHSGCTFLNVPDGRYNCSITLYKGRISNLFQKYLHCKSTWMTLISCCMGRSWSSASDRVGSQEQWSVQGCNSFEEYYNDSI